MEHPRTNASWRTVGHDRAIQTLRRSWSDERISHAYLLTGPRHVGKMTLAMDLARMLNCLGEDKPCGRCAQCGRIAESLHADVRVIGVKSEKTEDGRPRVVIGIGQVREVQREASLKPYEGNCRVFIFEGAEKLSEAAANSLLKILEEPPEQVVLVLIATDAGGLLPTIVSRCRQVNLRPVPPEVVSKELVSRYEVEAEKVEEVTRLSGGRLGWAIRMMDEPESLEQRAASLDTIEEVLRGSLELRFSYAAELASSFFADREPVRDELALWLEWWRDVMVTKEGATELVTNLSRSDSFRAVASRLGLEQIYSAIRAVQETVNHLDRNVNPRLAVEELMLQLPRTGGVAA